MCHVRWVAGYTVTADSVWLYGYIQKEGIVHYIHVPMSVQD